MGILLSKIVSTFVYPLGAAILLIGIAFLASFHRLRRLVVFAITTALIGLWVSATPIAANVITGRLESDYPPADFQRLPPVDVIVVLGGFVGQPVPPRLEPDLSDAVDRVITALRLYRIGKAPRILISGGNLPWQALAAPEAELAADFLMELGVPRTAIFLETASRNTRENALNAKKIMDETGWKTGLLVTSGAHMPRALAAFRTVGLDLTPVSTDIRSRLLLVESPLDFLPDAGALAMTTAAVKEWIGLAVYRYRGWA
jgi:uncharacterized SAM-binding protein YcdF (DUF218 family)